jgi:hypothetical protein
MPSESFAAEIAFSAFSESLSGFKARMATSKSPTCGHPKIPHL